MNLFILKHLKIINERLVILFNWKMKIYQAYKPVKRLPFSVYYFYYLVEYIQPAFCFLK